MKRIPPVENIYHILPHKMRISNGIFPTEFPGQRRKLGLLFLVKNANRDGPSKRHNLFLQDWRNFVKKRYLPGIAESKVWKISQFIQTDEDYCPLTHPFFGDTVLKQMKAALKFALSLSNGCIINECRLIRNL